MSFPLCSDKLGSLYANVAIRWQNAPRESCPPIESILTIIAQLSAMIPFNPGNLKELDHCVTCLHPDQLEGHTKSLVNASRDIAARSFSKSTGNDQLPQKTSLLGALELIDIKKLPKAQFLQLLIELVQTTQLVNLEPGTTWWDFLSAIYLSDHTFVEVSDNCLNLLNFVSYQQQLEKDKYLKSLNFFTLASQRCHALRIGLRKVEEICQLPNSQRLEEVLSAPHRTREQIHEKHTQLLQFSCSVLWAEQQIHKNLQIFFAWLGEVFPYKNPTRTWHQFIDDYEQLLMHKSTCLIILVEGEDQKSFAKLFNQYVDGANQLKYDIEIELSMLEPTAHDKYLERIQSYCETLKNQPIPGYLQGRELLWEQWLVETLQAVQLVAIKNCINLNFNLLYRFFQTVLSPSGVRLVDRRHALHLSPGIALIQDQLFPLWKEFFEDCSPLNLNREESLTGLEITRRAFDMAAASRIELYHSLRIQLTKKLKTYHQTRYRSIFARNHFSSDVSDTLPGWLIPHDDRGQYFEVPFSDLSISPNANPACSKKLERVKNRVEKSPLDDPPDGDEPREILDLVTFQTMANRRSKAHVLNTWKTDIRYDRRVTRWFKAKYRLSKKKFPTYWEASEDHQNLMICLHRNLPMVDFFVQRGVELPDQVRYGEKVKRIALPAELTYRNETKSGVLIWAFDEDETCYHRFFHQRIDQESNSYLKTLEHALGEESDDHNQMASSAGDAVQLIFSTQSKENSIEIDDVMGTARLSSAEYPDIALKVFFMKF